MVGGGARSFKHLLLNNQSEPPAADLVLGRLGFGTSGLSRGLQVKLIPDVDGPRAFRSTAFADL